MNDESVTVAERVLLRAFKESRDTAVIVLDEEGVIVMWTGASEQMFGYRSDEIVGKPYRLLFAKKDIELGLDRQELVVALQASRSEDDRWHVRKDGSRFWGSGILQRVSASDHACTAFVKTVRDRTDVRIQQEAVAARLRAAKALSSERLRLLVSVSTRVRERLAALQAHVEASSDDVALRVVKDIDLSLTKLQSAAHSETEEPNLHFERVAVAEVVAQGLASVQELTKRRGQTVEVVLPAAQLSLETDGEQLTRALAELLTHALKRSFDAGRVLLSVGAEAGMAVFRVEDYGQGMAPDKLDQIFDLFTSETQVNDRAAGLSGLRAVKQFARRYNGFVEAKSVGSGLGSVVTLRLPLSQSFA